MTPFPDYLAHALATRTVQEGQCLLWTGTHRAGSPQMRLTQPKRRMVMVRRAILECQHGGALPPGLYAVAGCGEPRCVRPEHVRGMTVQQIGRRAADAGAWQGPLRAARIAQARRRQSRLTWDDIQAIRNAPTAKQAAADHGISRSHASLIRRALVWTMPVGGVFTQLVVASRQGR